MRHLLRNRPIMKLHSPMYDRLRHLFNGLLFVAMCSLCAGQLNAQSTPSTTAAKTQCESLKTVDFSAVADAPTQVTSTQAVDAQDNLPAYCKVEGYVYPQVGFELRLPLSDWNGKFLEVGCGGWCGVIIASSCDAPMQRGYACIASDMGHKGAVFDVLWAKDNLQAQIDFGYRATHVAAVIGKAIAERFYQKRPNRSYFMGCSTGGYQGATAAQKFPGDFDGIVAGAPDIDGAMANLRVAWILRSYLDENGQPRLTSQDLQIAHDAALARCDLDDGVKDGIIGNPTACRVDAKSLICKQGQSDQCFSEAKADSIDKLYAGASNSTGGRISTGGFLPGSELKWSQFWPADSLEQFFRYGIPGYTIPPNWKYTDIDFDRDHKRFGLATYYDNSNPDLRKFKQAGGKLIMYHGGDDTINLPGAVTDYYETVEKTMGGRVATQDFFRLFMVPGMDHCTGGKGAHAVDWLTPLEEWVEQGKAPKVVMGGHVNEDYLAAQRHPHGTAGAVYALKFPLDASVRIDFTRPVYPYPAYAKYKGRGNVNDAASFRRVDPVKPH